MTIAIYGPTSYGAYHQEIYSPNESIKGCIFWNGECLKLYQINGHLVKGR